MCASCSENFGRFRKEKLVGEDEREALLDKELALPIPNQQRDPFHRHPPPTR